MIRHLFKSRRFWKLAGVAVCASFIIVGAAPANGEPRALHALFGGDQSKQLFFTAGLLVFIFGFVIPVSRMTVNLLRIESAVAVLISGSLWTVGVWNIPRFIQTHPDVAVFAFGALTLVPLAVGLLLVANRPPKRSGKFSRLNQPHE